MKMRTVCYGSDVYHKPGCHYVAMMKRENRLDVTKANAIAHDCHVCKYCNSIHYHLNVEDSFIRSYKNKYGFDFVVIGDALYVRTEISCWKIAYIKSQEHFTLFHINRVPENFDFTHPQTCRYHFQADAPQSESIAHYLRYIYEHDRYKAAANAGETITDFTSHRARNLAARSDKKLEKRRLNYLFKQLEQENRGLRELSYC
ncbi:hypothetical protein SAMN02910339_01378 [Lachnospiraceae bacterium YSD2013]|nr:hypothetical protein SAMN02910339_01378 [Lachnospiraceae bacterium YSD2013]